MSLFKSTVRSRPKLETDPRILWTIKKAVPDSIQSYSIKCAGVKISIPCFSIGVKNQTLFDSTRTRKRGRSGYIDIYQKYAWLP